MVTLDKAWIGRQCSAKTGIREDQARVGRPLPPALFPCCPAMASASGPLRNRSGGVRISDTGETGGVLDLQEGGWLCRSSPAWIRKDAGKTQRPGDATTRRIVAALTGSLSKLRDRQVEPCLRRDSGGIQLYISYFNCIMVSCIQVSVRTRTEGEGHPAIVCG